MTHRHEEMAVSLLKTLRVPAFLTPLTMAGIPGLRWGPAQLTRLGVTDPRALEGLARYGAAAHLKFDLLSARWGAAGPVRRIWQVDLLGFVPVLRLVREFSQVPRQVTCASAFTHPEFWSLFLSDLSTTVRLAGRNRQRVMAADAAGERHVSRRAVGWEFASDMTVRLQRFGISSGLPDRGRGRLPGGVDRAAFDAALGCLAFEEGRQELGFLRGVTALRATLWIAARRAAAMTRQPGHWEEPTLAQEMISAYGLGERQNVTLDQVLWIWPELRGLSGAHRYLRDGAPDPVELDRLLGDVPAPLRDGLRRLTGESRLRAAAKLRLAIRSCGQGPVLAAAQAAAGHWVRELPGVLQTVWAAEYPSVASEPNLRNWGWLRADLVKLTQRPLECLGLEQWAALETALGDGTPDGPLPKLLSGALITLRAAEGTDPLLRERRVEVVNAALLRMDRTDERFAALAAEQLAAAGEKVDVSQLSMRSPRSFSRPLLAAQVTVMDTPYGPKVRAVFARRAVRFTQGTLGRLENRLTVVIRTDGMTVERALRAPGYVERVTECRRRLPEVPEVLGELLREALVSDEFALVAPELRGARPTGRDARAARQLTWAKRRESLGFTVDAGGRLCRDGQPLQWRSISPAG